MTKVPSTVDSMIFERLKKPLKIIVRFCVKKIEIPSLFLIPYLINHKSITLMPHSIQILLTFDI